MNSEAAQELLLSAGTMNFDSNPVVVMLAIIGMALLPFVVLALTSFIKLSVVFGILRNAIGAQQVPSGAIISLLSLVLTVHIMAPVFNECVDKVRESASLERTASSTKTALPKELERLFVLGGAAAEPFRDFLTKHSRQRERVFFANMSHLSSNKDDKLTLSPDVICEKDDKNPSQCSLKGESFATLVPAFVLSELREAFAIGFTVYLPFLVIDLVIANLLVGLGMMMVSPVSIALPFKIVLFVLCDGWFLLCRGLVLGYL